MTSAHPTKVNPTVHATRLRARARDPVRPPGGRGQVHGEQRLLAVQKQPGQESPGRQEGGRLRVATTIVTSSVSIGAEPPPTSDGCVCRP
jgi:hypothetical protein